MEDKGDFLMSDGKRGHPLTVCDDHGRFNLVLVAYLSMKTGTVREHLEEAFKRYGIPAVILCDNGPPWRANFRK
jgi:transposase InsO family protein